MNNSQLTPFKYPNLTKASKKRNIKKRVTRKN